MLETLRDFGAGLLTGAGEQDQVQAALARYALGVAEQAGAGVQTTTGELAGARWLDAEDATVGHVLAWAVEHDLDTAARLVTALSVWWVLRGRLAGQGPLLRELAGRAGPGSAGWCAAQVWLAWTAFGAADLPQALQRCAAVMEAIGAREPSRLLADCLTVQSETLANLGRVPEAAECGRRALALARELDYPFGIARATACLVLAALYAGDLDQAAQLARQARQIPDIPGTAGRLCGFLLAATLAEAGDLAGAGQAGAATLAWARDAGDAYSPDGLLTVMADLDLRAGRAGDAAGRLHEAVRLMLSSGERFMMVAVLERCGQLCAATGRPADAVTAWAAMETLVQQGGLQNPDDSAGRRRQDALRKAGRALGPDRARATEQRGKAMSLTTAAEYALMLTSPGSP
jgi:tetratricopeptide (TPR) repeat protein